MFRQSSVITAETPFFLPLPDRENDKPFIGAVFLTFSLPVLKSGGGGGLFSVMDKLLATENGLYAHVFYVL